MNKSIGRTSIIFVGTLLLAACAPGSGDGEPPESAPEEPDRETETTDTARDASTRVALPGLFGIMAGLETEMAQISRGLWLEDFDTIAAAAGAVAGHPRVPPEEFQRISTVLGEEMPSFGGMDMRVHDLAVRLAEEAGRGELGAVLSTDAELRQACVSCHSTFRERLREEIR